MTSEKGADNAINATTVEIVRRRLGAQRLTRQDLEATAEVVRWFGATQAQEYQWSLYALSLRMPESANVTEADVEQTIAARGIVRTWPMRGTIHFVPAEDAQWMLRLLARRTNRTAASVYRRAGLSDDDFARAGAALVEALRGGQVLPRKALYAALEAAGLATGGEQRGLHLLGYWSREGLLCLGPRAGKQPTFTLLDEWIPNGIQLDDEQALATLALRYYTSHGPATVRDFAWWAGLTLGEARQAIALAADGLAQQSIAGEMYWFGAQTPPDAQDTAQFDHNAWLLPPYDEYTVAYADRSAMLQAAGATTDPFVILGPVIMVDGQLVGSWKRTLARDVALLTLTLFAPLDDEQRALIEWAATRYGRFVALPVNVTWNEQG